eukprot:jgi/Undpi1/5199/HiC_scaffold_2.g00481.m1
MRTVAGRKMRENEVVRSTSEGSGEQKERGQEQDVISGVGDEDSEDVDEDNEGLDKDSQGKDEDNWGKDGGERDLVRVVLLLLLSFASAYARGVLYVPF